MLTAGIKGVFLFCLQALFYGIFLAAGFWICGKATGHFDYWWALWNVDRERFWREWNEKPGTKTPERSEERSDEHTSQSNNIPPNPNTPPEEIIENKTPSAAAAPS